MSKVTLLHFAERSDTSGYFPQLARWHDRTRYRMIFATLYPTEPWLRAYMEEQGVLCWSCEAGGRADFPRAVRRLRDFLRRQRVEILHAHLFEPAVVGLLAGALARTPVRVLTRHYSDYHTRDDKRWHVRLDRLCTALAHRVIAVSEHTAETMIAAEKAPPDKLSVVLNGVDFDRLKPSSPEVSPEVLRREFAPDGELLLLQVARLHPEKGHEFLFRALPQVRERLKQPVRLLVAGAGPFEAEYRRQVRGLGIEEKVLFLGHRRDIADLIAAADIMVLPSVAEAFGLALTEALYLGTPVVATRVGGIPEIIADGEDGLLVAPASPDELAAAIVRLAQDETLRNQMAGAGRDKVVQRFSFERMVREYEQLYAELLNQRQN